MKVPLEPGSSAGVNSNGSPGRHQSVCQPGEAGRGRRFGFGSSGSRRGAASERASIAGRVLGGVAVAPMTRGLQGVLICRWGTAFDSREGGGLGRPSWAVRLGELWQRSPCLCNGGLVLECHRDRRLDGHLGCHWCAICGHAARTTAPASPFARFPTSGEESELRATLRTHARTFGAAGQVLGRGPNDPTAAVVHLVLADLAPRGADV